VLPFTYNCISDLLRVAFAEFNSYYCVVENSLKFWVENWTYYCDE
jgi:hypothetical protein